RDPFGSQAQAIISSELARTHAFEALKGNLAEKGQLDPGVATHLGVLVNANTRAVALRQLQREYIRVAILRDDAREQDIDALEADLQMAKSFKQEYTFTNTLLFVKDLVDKYRKQPEEIAVALGYASQKADRKELAKGREQVAQMLRMLALVREVMALSGNRIP